MNFTINLVRASGEAILDTLNICSMQCSQYFFRASGEAIVGTLKCFFNFKHFRIDDLLLKSNKFSFESIFPFILQCFFLGGASVLKNNGTSPPPSASRSRFRFVLRCSMFSGFRASGEAILGTQRCLESTPPSPP